MDGWMDRKRERERERGTDWNGPNERPMRAKALSNTRRKTVELQTITTDMAAAAADAAAADAATLLFYFFTTIDKTSMQEPNKAAASRPRWEKRAAGFLYFVLSSLLLPFFPSFSELINGFSFFFSLLLLYRGGGFSSTSSSSSVLCSVGWRSQRGAPRVDPSHTSPLDSDSLRSLFFFPCRCRCTVGVVKR